MSKRCGVTGFARSGGRAGQPYLALKVLCRPADQVQPLRDGPNTVVSDRIGTEWVAVDVA